MKEALKFVGAWYEWCEYDPLVGGWHMDYVAVDLHISPWDGIVHEYAFTGCH